MVINLIIWIIFGLLMSYLVVMGIITYGWFQLSLKRNQVIDKEVKLSIVVAVRNEAENIGQLLKQLTNQDYPVNLYDVIIIDDHSTDDTLEIVRSFENHENPMVKVIVAVGNGKKNALQEGISITSGDLIVTTDGDCEVGKGWLTGIVSHYCTYGHKVICGPVVYNTQKSLSSKFFNLDFASLVASGAGSIGVGLPLMGNAANMAFEKEVYNHSITNDGKYVSGDDVFLIHNTAKKHGYNSIGFVLNEDVIVKTIPPDGLAGFLKQRIRWASKAKGYKLPWPIIVSYTVFLFNLSLFAILLGCIFFNWLLPIYLLIIVTKYLIDMPLINRYLSFTGKGSLKPWLILMEVIYPVYIVIAAVSSLLFRFSWKGRDKLK